MPFKSQAYLASLDDSQYAQLLATHSQLGTHPETKDGSLIPTIDRFAGLYVLGVQGVGKSGLLENLIAQDIRSERAVTVIDPHGDLIDHCIAQLPEDLLHKVYVLDMTDEAHPFGVNVFAGNNLSTSIAQAQAVARVMHIFEVLWPEVLSQQHLPNLVRAATLTLFASLGKTLVDMLPLLKDDTFRQQLVKNVAKADVRSFWQSYDELSPTARDQKVAPLVNRLHALFMGRDLVRNIVGQSENTVDFRKAIENKEIIFIKLPIKTLAQDARLIGTLLVAQIHAAIFSFADLPEDQRPGFSLYVDEFQHFATPDFAEMFTEGRKFGVRVTVAHQYRGQLPTYLQQSTKTARTIVCFQCVPDDAREMGHFFLNGEATVRPEDVDPHPIEHLLKRGSDDPKVQTFIDIYLRPVQRFIHSGSVEIRKPGPRFDHAPFYLLGVKPPEEKVLVSDPLPQLNYLLYKVMSTEDETLFIPPEVVRGFANCGGGFFAAFRFAINKPRLLSSKVLFPHYLVAYRANGEPYWVRTPESGKEWLYHFLFHLRWMMRYLANNPIGKKSVLSASDVARMLTGLPRRAAFVRAGEDVGVIYTDDTPSMVDAATYHERLEQIQAQTRQKYCRAKDEVEKEPGDTTPEPGEPVAEPELSWWEEVE